MTQFSGFISPSLLLEFLDWNSSVKPCIASSTFLLFNLELDVGISWTKHNIALIGLCG